MFRRTDSGGTDDRFLSSVERSSAGEERQTTKGDRLSHPVSPAVALLALALATIAPLSAQPERRGRIDVQDYTIDAEISPNTQSLSARAALRFIPSDDGLTFLTFELNNALNISHVDDAQGRPLQISRNQGDFTVRVNFPRPLPKGQPSSLAFYYDGKLSGQEESPIEGITFAAIHPDYAYLLYPARWFPVSGYTTDRFGADLRITVPTGYSVLGSGIDSRQASGDKNLFEFKMDRPSFPGSIAVVKDQPIKVDTEGVTTTLYFRDPEKAMAQAYGEEIGKMMGYFTGTFGLAAYANLTVVETEPGAPNGYAAPGMIFLAPHGITQSVASRLLANEVSRQWWEELVSSASRNHLWLTNGTAAYSELLWTEHTAGAGAMQNQLNNEMIAALTVDNVPLIQSSRLDDYSPEFWALTGSKGATVMNMLRYVLGDDTFFKVLKQYAKQCAWQAVTTEDLRKIIENVTGKDIGYFFIQWIESSGAPEFKLEYTIYRVQKGFRVMGKVSQDLDTFRMPVELKIETEGNPESTRVEVMGTSSEFSVDTFGKPKNIQIDPDSRVLRYSPLMRVQVAIRRGEQYAEMSDFANALREYSKALETNRTSSLASYRIGEIYFKQSNLQSAANSFRESLNGDLTPKWTEVWSHINLGQIYDITGQRDRAVNEYNLALRTKDNTQNAQAEASKYLKAPYQREKRAEQ
jgi:tetratricopeptide (TPR) repeat protein